MAEHPGKPKKRNKKPYAINKNKYLLDPEYEHLEILLKRYVLKEKRNCLLIYIAMHTGARATEILNIEKKI